MTSNQSLLTDWHLEYIQVFLLYVFFYECFFIDLGKYKSAVIQHPSTIIWNNILKFVENAVYFVKNRLKN